METWKYYSCIGITLISGSLSCTDSSDKSLLPDDSQNVNPDILTAAPNVLVIMTDQQSYNAVSALAMGDREDYFSSTPNIDRLVRSGVAFTRAYCANPVSVPSRFSLFTGMYGGAFGVRDNKCELADETKIRELQKKQALGVLFKKAGYETYYGGKVHLPFSTDKGTSKFAAPVAYGFDTYYTKNEREELGTETARFLASRKITDKPFLLVASFLNPHDICLESSTNLSSVINDSDPEKVATVQMMRDRAAAIDSLTFYSSHAPSLPANFEVTSQYPPTKCSKKRFLNFPDWYWRKYRWTYGQMVSLVDQHIGQILDALDRNPELKRNTIIVFTSDHGEMQGAHHAVTKSLPFDECQRIPFVISGRSVKATGTSELLTNNGVDLLPTLCELAGIKIPEGCDGMSLASVIKGESKAVKDREFLYMESETFFSIVTDEYKYTCFDLDGNYKMLIDKANDKGELINIASKRPDVIRYFDQLSIPLYIVKQSE